jgi:hypothetical protein
LVVGLDRPGPVGGGRGLDGDLAFGGQRADQVDGVLDDLEHLHRLQRQRQAARLDAGDVEHLVDQLEQVAAAVEHVLDALGLLGGQVLELEQLPEPEDGVERGAQLVAHPGEELALGPVGPLGVPPGLLERLLGAAAFGDVVGEGVEDGLRPRPDRPDHHLHREQVAVAVQGVDLDPAVQQRPLPRRQVVAASLLVGVPRRLGDDQLHQRPADRLGGGPAEGLLGPPVPCGDPPAGVDRDEGLGRGGQQLLGPLLGISVSASGLRQYELLGNRAIANVKVGIHLGPATDDVVLKGNKALENALDCQDESVGESATDGTAGTENSWEDNAGISQLPDGICGPPGPDRPRDGDGKGHKKRKKRDPCRCTLPWRL